MGVLISLICTWVFIRRCCLAKLTWWTWETLHLLSNNMLVCLDVLFLLREEGKLWESANVVSLFQNMSQIKLNMRCSLHCQHFQFPVGCVMTESISTNKTAPRLASWYCYGGVLNCQGQSLSPHGACSADPSDNQEVKLSVSWMHFQVGQVSRSQIFHMLKYFSVNVSVVFCSFQEDIGPTISKKMWCILRETNA